MLAGNILGRKKGIRPFRHAPQHRICETCGTMGARARELHALAHRDLRRGSQVEQLIRTDAQRVAHIDRKRAWVVEDAIERVVQATGATRDAQRETARERGVSSIERHGGAKVRRDLTGIAPRLARGNQDAQRGEAARGKLCDLTQGDPKCPGPRAGRQPRTWRPSRACRQA